MPSSPSPDRRGFLAIVLGGAACAVPALAGLLGFLNPWRKSDNEDCASGEFIRVAALSEIGETPKQFPVISERSDAWTHSVEPVGSVYLYQPSPGKVAAFQVKCPHEGCPVRFDGDKKTFVCTCHSAVFDLAGDRLDPAHSQSPRNLDELGVEVRCEQVWVAYKEFCTGTPEKTVKT